MYAAIKRTDQEQIAVEKRQLVERVPLPLLAAPLACLRAVVVTCDGVEVERLGEGAYCGDKALINDEPRAATATGAYCAGRKHAGRSSRGAPCWCAGWCAATDRSPSCPHATHAHITPICLACLPA